MSTPAFGFALNPLRPDEITPPPGLAERPPYCPACPDDVLLYPGMQNGAGDMLFSCGNDGYEAIWRVESNSWVPRPGREVSQWEPPLMAPRGAPAAPRGLQGAPPPPVQAQTAPPPPVVDPEPAAALVEPLERPAPGPALEPEPDPEPVPPQARLLPPVLLLDTVDPDDDRVTPIED